MDVWSQTTSKAKNISVAKQSNKITLNASPLTTKELARKNAIQTFTEEITNEEMESANVLYYDFSEFDNPLCLRIFGYLMDDSNVLKFGATRDAFAIVISPLFDKINFEQNIKNIGLSFKPITKEEYQQSVTLINTK